MQNREGTPLYDYLAWFSGQKGASATSLRVYTGVLNAYIADVLGPLPLDGVTVEQMEAWTRRYRYGGQAGKRGRDPAPATISRDVAILKAFYKWAHARGLIERNPADLLVGPVVHNEQPRPVPDDVWVAWWGERLPVELRVALALGFYGGLRRDEIASLRCAQIDAEAGRLVGFVRKGGGQDVLPLGTGLDVYAKMLPHLLGEPAEVLEPLAYLARQEGLVVSWLEVYDGPWRGQEIARWIDRAAKKRDLPRFTPHQLRHSTATNLLRAGMPLALVSRYLNHRSIETTLRYAKLGEDEMRVWLEGTR